MSATTNESNLQRTFEAWNARNLDGYVEPYDSTIRLHGYSAAPMDKSAVREFHRMMHQAFDGPKLTFRLAIRFTMTGIPPVRPRGAGTQVDARGFGRSFGDFGLGCVANYCGDPTAKR